MSKQMNQTLHDQSIVAPLTIMTPKSFKKNLKKKQESPTIMLVTSTPIISPLVGEFGEDDSDMSSIVCSSISQSPRTSVEEENISTKAINQRSPNHLKIAKSQRVQSSNIVTEITETHHSRKTDKIVEVEPLNASHKADDIKITAAISKRDVKISSKSHTQTSDKADSAKTTAKRKTRARNKTDTVKNKEVNLRRSSGRTNNIKTTAVNHKNTSSKTNNSNITARSLTEATSGTDIVKHTPVNHKRASRKINIDKVTAKSETQATNDTGIVETTAVNHKKASRKINIDKVTARSETQATNDTDIVKNTAVNHKRSSRKTNIDKVTARSEKQATSGTDIVKNTAVIHKRASRKTNIDKVTAKSTTQATNDTDIVKTTAVNHKKASRKINIHKVTARSETQATNDTVKTTAVNQENRLNTAKNSVKSNVSQQRTTSSINERRSQLRKVKRKIDFDGENYAATNGLRNNKAVISRSRKCHVQDSELGHVLSVNDTDDFSPIRNKRKMLDDSWFIENAKKASKKVNALRSHKSPKNNKEKTTRSNRLDLVKNKSKMENKNVTDGVRKSSRQRFKPMEFWLGERVQYKLNNERCLEVVGYAEHF